MSVRIRGVEQLAEKNVRKWIQSRHAQDRLAQGKIEENVGPYLAISREAGAGGSEIARIVGRKLGWDVLDHEIVDYMADAYGTPRSLVQFADEKHISWIEEVFESWIEGQGFSSAAYVHRLNHLLLLAAHHGNVIVVGRGAQFILPRERGLSVRIVAPLDFRVEQIVKQRGLSEKDARRYVQDSDHQREAFVQANFHRSLADPHNFDLEINIEKLDRDAAADLIVDATRSWMKHSGVTTTNPDEVQEASEESFPASDAPAWTTGRAK